MVLPLSINSTMTLCFFSCAYVQLIYGPRHQVKSIPEQFADIIDAEMRAIEGEEGPSNAGASSSNAAGFVFLYFELLDR